ncbi:MAG: hypothetical protein L6V95_00635 [Candidatus Melainabacteria bacterium]|nr:MAG: hypothetical protein L6V95_00635 [Candidatus Melainabacteria bacterium]
MAVKKHTSEIYIFFKVCFNDLMFISLKDIIIKPRTKANSPKYAPLQPV